MAIWAKLTTEKSVHSWTKDNVSDFLHLNGMGRYADLLCRQNEVDGEILLLLRETDLRLPPISIPVLAHIKRIATLVEFLRDRELDDSGCLDDDALRRFEVKPQRNSRHPDGSLNGQELGLISRQLNAFSFSDDDFDVKDLFSYPSANNLLPSSALPSSSSSSSSLQRQKTPTFEPEIFKSFLSLMYAVFVALLTAFTMTVAHDRVPAMDKYPPLPDIFLDNVPRIEWAFQACEVCAIVLCVILTGVLIFHKHRFIILRRFFALTGTCFLLRCITMFATSLSVPGRHLQCSGKVYGNMWTKMRRALEIMSGLGMSVTGVHTCGDYMFSGHTICLTMFNFFITEYTPRSMTLLHTLSWVLNLFGSFFVLAAHEHYSIDVVIALYISSRLFLYYHTLANTHRRGSAHQSDKRTSVWFPMFSYLEARVEDEVPNQYEWPSVGIRRFLASMRQSKTSSD